METVVYEAGGKKYLGFVRVSYGKKDTPVEKREYKLEGVLTSPVGTRKEIKEFVKEVHNSFDGVALIEKPWSKTIGKRIKVVELVLIKDL